MKKYRFLLLSLLILPSPLGAIENLTAGKLIELFQKNNPQWQSEQLKIQQEEREYQNRAQVYDPYFSLALDPLYSFVNNQYLSDSDELYKTQTHSSSLSLSMALLLPSNGTLTAGISDTLSFTTYDSSTLAKQTPGFSLSLIQPLNINGKIIEGRSYESRKQTNWELPRKAGYLQIQQEINTLLATLLTDYYQLLILNEQFLIKKEEIELEQRELDQYALLKERGMLSGTDFWKKQLNVDQERDLLLEQQYELNSAMVSLTSSLGVHPNQISLPPLMLSRNTINLPSKNELLSGLTNNSELKLERLEYETRRQIEEGGLTQKGSDLSLTLGVSPQYSPYEGGTTLSSSFTDFMDNQAWIQTSLSLIWEYSPSDAKTDKIKGQIAETATEIARMNWENNRKSLEEQLQGLLEKDQMLNNKLDRINENIGYLNLLLEKEKKLMSLNATTPLIVDRAVFSVITLQLDKKTALVELCRNRLEILQLVGFDLKRLDYSQLSGEN